MTDYEVISESQIQLYTKKCADFLNSKFTNEDNVILIGILKGALYFMADLSRELKFSHEIDFIKVKTYEGTKSSKEFVIDSGFNVKSIQNKTVILVDELFDTGFTIGSVSNYIWQETKKEAYSITLLRKEIGHNQFPTFYGGDAPNLWLYGCGLDDNGKSRNLKSVWAKNIL